MKNWDDQIRALISKMTLEEKIGQLRQVGPSIVGAFEVSFEEMLDMLFDGRISQEEFDRKMGNSAQDFREDEIRAGKIGSFNGVGDAATSNRLQKIAVEESRLGIPLLFGFDVIHGYRTCRRSSETGRPEALERGNMSGAFFERYVFSEIYKSYLNAGQEPPIFYYRDKDQKEIDLLLCQNGTVTPSRPRNPRLPVRLPSRIFLFWSPLRSRIASAGCRN